MFRWQIRAATACVTLIAGLGSIGCAAQGTTNERSRPVGGGGGTSAAGAESAGAEEEGGSTEPARSGSGGTGNLNTNPNGDGGAPDESCAARVSKAETVPLDMYIMLDVSGSMLDPTS